MNYYLFALLTSTTVVGTIFSSVSPSVASDLTFNCQSNEGTPTTVATSGNGAEQPIFHWNLDAVSTSNTPEELCDSVTEKLNNYKSEGNDVSSLTFNPSVIGSGDGEMTGLPAVCIAGEDVPCKLSLFTLKPSVNPRDTADRALRSVLDLGLQASAGSSVRGVQSTNYEVNFWDLLRL